MARLMGINIPDNKRIVIGLTYIFGIGRSTAQQIAKQLNLDINQKVKDFTLQDLDKIKNFIEKNYKVEGDLRILVSQNIKRLKEINTYRGVRHLKKLPSRGQRTKTNARTKRGKKVCVGSGRRDTAQKT